MWKAKVREVYSSLEELRAYNRTYGIAARCGHRSALSLWRSNPKLQGSVYPADFGLAK